MKITDLIKNNKLFDSHCHLNDSSYDEDRAEVIERTKEAGLEAIVDIAVDENSAKKALENAREYDMVQAAVGIDPEMLIPGSDLFERQVFGMTDKEFETWLNIQKDWILELAKDDNVAMIGETGIDNYWLQKSSDIGIQHSAQRSKMQPSNKLSESASNSPLTANHLPLTTNRSQLTAESLEHQKKLFALHCDVAKEVEKPLSIHSRNAIETCLEVLAKRKVPKEMAVFHSLTPDIDDTEEVFEVKVRKILSQGYFIGINGIITFKNAKLIRNVYASILDVEADGLRSKSIEDFYSAGFIFETDGPYLAPEPHRGKRNEPAYIINFLFS